jgi:hypothetical protein
MDGWRTTAAYEQAGHCPDGSPEWGLGRRSVGQAVQERVDGGVVLGHPSDLGCLPIADVEDLGVLPLGAGPVPRRGFGLA